jgi:predicted GNAT family N-acyltransferase
MNNDTAICTEIPHGSAEYAQAVALRDEILRRPLGLTFTPEELRDEKDSFHLVCRIDGMLAACLVLKPLNGEHIRMRQLAVRRDLQGRGIGRTLVRYSESFAGNRGYTEMHLHARETAAEFYLKLGYEVNGDRFTEVTIPHFSMRKRVTGMECRKGTDTQ